jgi:hypothetical protein
MPCRRTLRLFPPPCTVIEHAESFRVQDAGVASAEAFNNRSRAMSLNAAGSVNTM